MSSPSPEGLKRLAEKLRDRYADPTHHPQWKGGRVKRSGYWYIKAKDHPRAGKQGYIAEHRLVMERLIGRYLEPAETVHHINGDKLDNRPENLQLFASHGQHTRHAHPESYERARQANLGRRPANYIREEFHCLICNTAFMASPNSGKKYCTRVCYWVSKKGKPSAYPEGLKKGRGWNKGKPAPWALKGVDHPHYKHGRYSKYSSKS